MVKRYTERPIPRVSKTGIIDLLRLVPTDVFVRMVTKSGLTTRQARALCEKFKELKA